MNPSIHSWEVKSFHSEKKAWIIYLSKDTIKLTTSSTYFPPSNLTTTLESSYLCLITSSKDATRSTLASKLSETLTKTPEINYLKAPLNRKNSSKKKIIKMLLTMKRIRRMKIANRYKNNLTSTKGSAKTCIGNSSKSYYGRLRLKISVDSLVKAVSRLLSTPYHP